MTTMSLCHRDFSNLQSYHVYERYDDDVKVSLTFFYPNLPCVAWDRKSFKLYSLDYIAALLFNKTSITKFQAELKKNKKFVLDAQ